MTASLGLTLRESNHQSNGLYKFHRCPFLPLFSSDILSIISVKRRGNRDMLKIVKHTNVKNTHIKQKIEKNKATRKFFSASCDEDGYNGPLEEFYVPLRRILRDF